MPKTVRRRQILALCAAALATAAHGRSDDKIVVFAAASLKESLERIAEAFKDDTGQEVSLSLAGSSILARQIARGAPADLYLSANTSWMDDVADGGRTVLGTQRNLLQNRLVIVSADPEAPPLDLTQPGDLLSRLAGGRLAMALVDAVPAGIYGRMALTSLGLWDAVAPYVAQADNVRAAMALVTSGAAPMGVVYATDAQASGLNVIAEFPARTHAPILYPVALLTNAPGPRAFYDYLLGPTARAIFEAAGFQVLG